MLAIFALILAIMMNAPWWVFVIVILLLWDETR